MSSSYMSVCRLSTQLLRPSMFASHSHVGATAAPSSSSFHSSAVCSFANMVNPELLDIKNPKILKRMMKAYEVKMKRIEDAQRSKTMKKREIDPLVLQARKELMAEGFSVPSPSSPPM
eukprot:JP437431.1.p1 GENE.JP437431.1~~JP437431.1.p1  ORF type:complete len:118 (-),score=20.52 JP437431.1:171-524(-)